MPNRTYCNVVDVCEFLAKHRMAKFTSYGSHTELVQGDDGQLAERDAIKPTTLFRGQTKSHDALRPTIYRSYPPLSTWQETQTVHIDGDSLVMPHPHYSADLERDFYFSCIKAAELIREVGAMFPQYPGQVDGHALCQHYGLTTHYLDFSEDVWIAGFFASHTYLDGSFLPCSDGVGVIYDLDTNNVPPRSIYEIGLQPLPRPHAQRGWLLQVPPEVKLLGHSAISTIYFQHSREASERIGELFQQGRSLLPRDPFATHVESRLRERSVSAVRIDSYLERVPPHHRDQLKSSIQKLFRDLIPIL
jgi:hypothetical protein